MMTNIQPQAQQMDWEEETLDERVRPLEVDSGEKRLNELGYKQELRREMSLLKTFGITFSSIAVFLGTPLYGSSILYAGPAPMIWGWVVVSFFTWFIGIAMAEICSSFPTAGSLYFWAGHLAAPRWAPFSSWCCAWLEVIGVISAIGVQAYSGSQTLQIIILLCTGTNKGGGYFAPNWVFLCMYIALTIIWAVLNIFSLQVVAYLNIISIWWQIQGIDQKNFRRSCQWRFFLSCIALLLCFTASFIYSRKVLQVIGGLVVTIMLPLVTPNTQSASYVFTHFKTSPEQTGISSTPYAVILSLLLSHYSLYGYDTAAHLTEETKGAEKTGPIAILSSIGVATFFGGAYFLALTFSIQDLNYLYDPNNETAGALVPAQIFYDAFQGRFHHSGGAIAFLIIVWGSFFFCGLSVTASAARVVYALSRDGGIPFSRVWRQLHPKYKVPKNAVWLSAAISIALGLPLLKVEVVFNAIVSISTIGWVGSYAVPMFVRLVMDEKNFKPGPFYLGRASRPICLVAFLWICYTCSVFLLPTEYPINWNTFNYAPVALSLCLTLIMLWWLLDARKWFKGPVRNVKLQNLNA